jgi:hypothetical protein
MEKSRNLNFRIFSKLKNETSFQKFETKNSNNMKDYEMSKPNLSIQPAIKEVYNENDLIFAIKYK